MWEPQRGPQSSALLADWCDELFYGGERGGGKSDFQLGYQEDGALRYVGKSRGIMFRKTYAELEELQARATQIFPGSGAIYKTQPSADYPFSNCWYWQNGATVKMRFIEHARDYGRYHGHQYCVAAGTAIVMATGERKSIEEIRVGDSILTLEGSKPVTALMAPYETECVRATVRDAQGRVIGAQVHPVSHPLLTSVSSFSESLDGQCQIGARLRQYLDSWQSYESLTCAYPDSRAADVRQAGVSSYCRESADVRPSGPQLAPLSVPVVLASQVVQSSRLLSRLTSTQSNGLCTPDESYVGLDRANASEYLDWQQLNEHRQLFAGQEPASADRDGRACGVLEIGEVQGFVGDYQCDHHSDDGQPQIDSVIGQGPSPSQDGVALPVLGESRMDETDCIRGDSHQALCKYTHPYTKELRPVVIPVESGTVELEPCGSYLVYDITVEDANHYISDCGLINKNTHISFDEVTEYDTPAGLLKMLSTLRSAHGVPCTVRLTGNPGGVGHIWVKARYIDIGAPLTPYTDPETGFTRMFVPSKTSDNQILMLSDPHYRNRILAATGGNDALRKAWLEGDWDVIAGAFFDCWRRERHVIKTFTVPQGWTRFRSFDWGSARPFSVGWWTISNGEELPDGRIYPRGSLIRYREWYGCKTGEPNIGLKMDAEDVAKGIVDRSGNEEYEYSVADPACKIRNGGPSIKERMFNAGDYPSILFKDGDNSRITGWDQMRGRLIGDDEPMLYTFDTCVDSIRTIPLMQHDELKIEDIDTDMEDHCFAAGTMVETDRGPVRIEQLQECGRVLSTGDKYRAYRSARMVKRDADLVKVVFENGAQVFCTPDHKFLIDADEWSYARDLINKEVLCSQSSLAARFKSLTVSGITCVAGTSSAKALGFISKYGSIITERFQRAIKSTIGTKTGQTTDQETLSASPCLTILAVGTAQQAASAHCKASTRRKSLPLCGMAPRLESNGILSIMRNTSSRSWTCAFLRCAESAARHTWSVLAESSKGSTAATTVRRVRCVSVEKAGRADVYCITVPTTATFAIEGGILVSNCADEWRYACMSRPFVRADRGPKKPIFKDASSMTFAEILAHNKRKNRE